MYSFSWCLLLYKKIVNCWNVVDRFVCTHSLPTHAVLCSVNFCHLFKKCRSRCTATKIVAFHLYPPQTPTPPPHQPWTAAWTTSLCNRKAISSAVHRGECGKINSKSLMPEELPLSSGHIWWRLTVGACSGKGRTVLMVARHSRVFFFVGAYSTRKLAKSLATTSRLMGKWKWVHRLWKNTCRCFHWVRMRCVTCSTYVSTVECAESHLGNWIGRLPCSVLKKIFGDTAAWPLSNLHRNDNAKRAPLEMLKEKKTMC